MASRNVGVAVAGQLDPASLLLCKSVSETCVSLRG
jgi:hypothetical protein